MLHWIFSTYFYRSPDVKLKKIPSVGAELYRETEEASSSFRQLGFYKPKTWQDIRALEVAVVFVCLRSECLSCKVLYLLTYLDLYTSLSIVGLVKTSTLR
jgi:hypothetical protein